MRATNQDIYLMKHLDREDSTPGMELSVPRHGESGADRPALDICSPILDERVEAPR